MIMKVVTFFFFQESESVTHPDLNICYSKHSKKKLWIRDFKKQIRDFDFCILKIPPFSAVQVTEGPHSVQKRFLNVMSHVVLQKKA